MRRKASSTASIRKCRGSKPKSASSAKNASAWKRSTPAYQLTAADALGNIPQGLTHVGLINAAISKKKEDRRRGSVFPDRYHQEIIKTPNLDRFASQAAVFDRAFTAAPVTPTSFAAAFSGHHPHEVFRGWSFVAEEPLAKRFSAAGWRVITCSRHPFPENCPWEAGPEDRVGSS